MIYLPIILKLKRSTIDGFNPLNWLEVAQRIGKKSAQLAQYHARREMRGESCSRCPSCLQELERIKK